MITMGREDPGDFYPKINKWGGECVVPGGWGNGHVITWLP
jgi:hypothetical protein